jgi:gliding motility-associated-like protein
VNAIPQVSFESQSFCSSTVDFDYIITSISSTLDVTSHFWIIQGDSIFAVSPTVVVNSGSGNYDAQFGLVAANGCVYNYDFSYFVDSEIDISNFVLPNVVTANGDGTNDLFLVDPYFDLCVAYTIEFINRWGQPVYTMTSNANAFGGTDSNGDALPIGVYFYKFTSELIELHGFVHVIR